jgi:hypothetical protein
LGGILAAPLAAIFVKIIRPKPIMIVVGCLITLISLYNIYRSFPAFEGLIIKVF